MTTAVAVLALVVAAAAGLGVAAVRRRLGRELRHAREQIDALAQRVERLERGGRGFDAPAHDVPHVITSLADPAHPAHPANPAEDLGRRPTGREFVSVALGESLLKAAALAHGVRRASSPENRNRIRFEMAREVKRQRRQRRLDLREARRRLRAEQLHRNAADPSLREDAA